MSAPHAIKGGIARLSCWLSAPVDGASLAVFRICFGLVMVWHVFNYLKPVAGTTRVQFLYADPGWHFAYRGFAWVEPWPEPFLTWHFIIVGLAGLFVACGLFYRYAATLLFVSYQYVFLLDQSNYNNHYYLMCLVAFLLIWMPAARRFSLDAYLEQRRGIDQPANTCVPFWCVFLLRFQLFVVYFYGGIAKFNADWFTGEPLLAAGEKLHALLGLPASVPVIQLCLLLAWGGLVYDLSIGFLLIFRRTRLLAIVLTLLFHLHNHLIFPIGVFPLMAFSTTLIFCEPDWPVRVARWFRRPKLTRPDMSWLTAGAILVPVAGAALGWKDRASGRGEQRAINLSWPLKAFLACWCSFQLLFPLRHYLIPGDANWTEQGQHFAWRMMLRAKAVGHVTFHVHDPTFHVTDARGRPQFNWDQWPASRPRAVYVPIDSHLFNWDHHPGLTMTYEPTLGLRVIVNSVGVGRDTKADIEVARQQTEAKWQDAFGETPFVESTLSIPAALEHASADLRLAYQQTPHDDQLFELLDQVETLRDVVSAPPPEAASFIDRERHFIVVSDVLKQLVGSRHYSIIAPHIRRIHPFALQGAHYPDQQFLVVSAPHKSLSEEQLQTLAGGKAYLVWLDLSRARPETWQGLPQQFVTYENRELKVVWNHFQELNSIQLSRFPVDPDAIHQYAAHVASRWQSQTGRRPQVYVSSLVMLNYRQPQMLIDPAVDLAGVPYHLFSPNSWILPLEGKRLFAETPQDTRLRQ